MNLFLFIPFFSFIIELFTWSYVFSRNRRSALNKAYLINSGFVIIWTWFDLVTWGPVDLANLDLLIRIESIFWLPVGTLFLYFTYVFLKKKMDLILFVSFFLSAMAIIISFTTDLIVAGYLQFYWGVNLKAGPLFVPTTFTIMSMPFIYSFFLFIKKLKITSDPLARRQLLLIVVGTGLTFFTGLTTEVIIPQVLKITDFVQPGPGVVVFHTVFLFIAITRYNFFDITVKEAAEEIFASLHDGIIIMDQERTIIKANQVSIKMLGLQGQNIREIILSQHIQNYSYEENYYDFETRIKSSENDTALSLSQSSLSEHGIVIGKILMIRDISERIKAEKEIRNKNQQIKDSLEYAGLIQASFLPTAEMLQNSLPNSFVFSKPKDIVSGDFFWTGTFINDLDGKVKTFFGVIDCTGHGIPGAFTSLICYDLLQRAFHKNRHLSPSDVIIKLNKLFTDSRLQNGNSTYVKSGMELGLCSFDPSGNSLEYCGVNHPLLIVRAEASPASSEIIEIKPSRSQIGEKSTEDASFINHKIMLRPGDMVYLFTDGFPDQKGGPEGKKFLSSALRELLKTISQKEVEIQKELIEKEIVSWMNCKGPNGKPFAQVDDIMVAGIRV